MWADVNTKPVQGLLFRKFRHEMMGVPVEYDDDVERRNTHPMLLPKDENERLTIPESELLKEIAVLAPVKRRPKTKKASKRVIPRMSRTWRRRVNRSRSVWSRLTLRDGGEKGP